MTIQVTSWVLSLLPLDFLEELYPVGDICALEKVCQTLSTIFSAHLSAFPAGPCFESRGVPTDRDCIAWTAELLRTLRFPQR